MKSAYYLGATVGSLVGLLPYCWGDGLFSLTSIILSVIGGLFGIFVVWKIADYLGI